MDIAGHSPFCHLRDNLRAYKKMGWNIEDFPNAFHYFENEITLPLHTKLTNDDVEYVVKNYMETVKEYLPSVQDFYFSA